MESLCAPRDRAANTLPKQALMANLPWGWRTETRWKKGGRARLMKLAFLTNNLWPISKTCAFCLQFPFSPLETGVFPFVGNLKPGGALINENNLRLNQLDGTNSAQNVQEHVASATGISSPTKRKNSGCREFLFLQISKIIGVFVEKGFFLDFFIDIYTTL